MVNLGMNKFSDWLDHNPGMATRLAKFLNVNSSSICNCKKGRLLMPAHWMPVISNLSRGQLTLKELLAERSKQRLERMLKKG